MSAAVKRASSSWRMCGLASMYPAFDWSWCSGISARTRSYYRLGLERAIWVTSVRMRSFAATHQVRFSALYGSPRNDAVWGYINKSWRPPVPSGRAPRAQRRLRHSPSAVRR
jgi:hypothetical protein